MVLFVLEGLLELLELRQNSSWLKILSFEQTTDQSRVKSDETMTGCRGGCHQIPNNGADEIKLTHITVVRKLRQ